MAERITGNTFFYLPQTSSSMCPTYNCPLTKFSHYVRENQTELTFEEAQEDALLRGFTIEDMKPEFNGATLSFERRAKVYCTRRKKGRDACGITFLSERSL